MNILENNSLQVAVYDTNYSTKVMSFFLIP